ncbi:MAG: hypothetical protein Q7K03_00885 [Dehalococcoidia bacterium]|nr:hypothetical protein [Dehalococcoidia bacterium]
MEELLPGLVRVMEERLGKLGRPLTTVVVLCLALGASAWGLKSFWDYMVFPIAQFVQAFMAASPMTLADFATKVLTPFAIYVVLASGVLALGVLFIHKRISEAR